MFADKIKVQLSDRPVIYERGTKLAKYPQLPTSPQAEILVRGVIEQKYIKFETKDKWFGVTYKEDKEMVVSAISKMIEDGLYEGI